MKFSSTLKELREQNHVTQNQLASHLKLTAPQSRDMRQKESSRTTNVCFRLQTIFTYRLIICSQALKPTVFLFRRILPNTVCSVRI